MPSHSHAGVTLSRAELVTVLNALLNRLFDDFYPITRDEQDLYEELKAIGVEIGLRKNENGWWYEPELGEV